MSHARFLGACILVAAVLVSGAIVYHARSQVGRYQFHPSSPPGVIWIIDTTTGEVKTQSG
jgi:hypothetical protein